MDLGNIRNLVTQEQLKKGLIGCGVGIGLLVALHFLVWSTLFTDRRRLHDDIETLTEELAENRKLVEETAQSEELFCEEGLELAQIMAQQLAPAQDPVSWAGSVIQEQAAATAATVVSLSQGGIGPLRSGVISKGGSGKDKGGRAVRTLPHQPQPEGEVPRLWPVSCFP